MAITDKEWYKKNRDKVSSNNHKHYASMGKSFKTALWANAKARAKRKNVAFDITPSDIVVPEVCLYLVYLCALVKEDQAMPLLL